MFKRVGALLLMLAGGMAVFTPAVAQARDRDDYRRYERHDDRRDWERRDGDRRDFGRGERREWRDERFERRDYRPVYGYGFNYGPVYYDRYGRPCR